MIRPFFISVMALALAACTFESPEVSGRRQALEVALPPMKTFQTPHVTPPARSNVAIAADILDLIFRLESGRRLERLTRFEAPITVRVRGNAPPSLSPDLNRLLKRIRNETGIDIRRVESNVPAGVTIEVIDRKTLQRAVPQAACFVVPRMSSWREFRANRRSSKLDWTTLQTRNKMAVFLPGDVSPQEIRDCLHEELAQAIGPLNDLYHLQDSVFNDDNFHTVLTGFDMLVLKTIYSPELRSGMSRSQVAARLPGILNRLNPAGRRKSGAPASPTPREWIDDIETALGPNTAGPRRRAAARDAVQIATDLGWTDTRLAFSLYALGRLSLSTEPELAIAAFLQAGSIYGSDPATKLQAAHVTMQMAAFALSAGQGDVALDMINEAILPVAQAENAALLAMLLMVKAEALELEGRLSEAREVRADSLGWARYGFGSDAEVRARMKEIAALAPPANPGETGT